MRVEEFGLGVKGSRIDGLRVPPRPLCPHGCAEAVARRDHVDCLVVRARHRGGREDFDDLVCGVGMRVEG